MVSGPSENGFGFDRRDRVWGLRGGPSAIGFDRGVGGFSPFPAFGRVRSRWPSRAGFRVRGSSARSRWRAASSGIPVPVGVGRDRFCATSGAGSCVRRRRVRLRLRGDSRSISGWVVSGVIVFERGFARVVGSGRCPARSFSCAKLRRIHRSGVSQLGILPRSSSRLEPLKPLESGGGVVLMARYRRRFAGWLSAFWPQIAAAVFSILWLVSLMVVPSGEPPVVGTPLEWSRTIRSGLPHSAGGRCAPWWRTRGPGLIGVVEF